MLSEMDTNLMVRFPELVIINEPPAAWNTAFRNFKPTKIIVANRDDSPMKIITLICDKHMTGGFSVTMNDDTSMAALRSPLVNILFTFEK